MPRPDRETVPGLPHHVRHRGNRREKTFIEDEDYRIYLRLLRKATQRYGVRIWDYALMPNHIHLVAVPEGKESLSKAIQWAHGKYAQVFNALYEKVGHLWEGRFKSSVMDEGYLFNAVRYVERNPVRAGLVARAEDYPWSSAAARCGLRHDPLLADDLPLIRIIESWPAYLACVESDEELRRIRECTERSFPYASDGFVRELERKLGCKFSLPKPRRKKGDEGSDPSSLLPLW